MCWMRRSVSETPFHIKIKEETQMFNKINHTGDNGDGTGTVRL